MQRSLVFVLCAALASLLVGGCYDRGIVDAKDFGYTLPNVENLAYATEGNTVTLTWDIPDGISPAFKRPVEVSIQKVENDIYREIIIVGVEGTSRDIDIDPANTYRFIVKLAGYLTDDARETGKPDRVYSAGEVIIVQ